MELRGGGAICGVDGFVGAGRDEIADVKVERAHHRGAAADDAEVHFQTVWGFSWYIL